MKTKLCRQCGHDLPLSCFYTSKHSSTGVMGECKECNKKRARDFKMRKYYGV